MLRKTSSSSLIPGSGKLLPSNPQSQNWMFTINNPRPQDEPNAFITTDMYAYLCYQPEIGENGTPHFQGYVRFQKRWSFRQVKKLHSLAHWEIRKGSHEQAVAYCTKTATRVQGQAPIILGDYSEGKGHRQDLVDLKETIDTGAPIKVVADAHFGTFLKYSRGIMAYRLLRSKVRNWIPDVTVIYGPTGTGKSRAARAYAGEEDTYWYFPQEGQKWWDGYDGESTVIIDEFYPGAQKWRHSDVLRLFDSTPLFVQIKGGSIPMLARHFIITSNSAPDEWYQTLFQAIPAKYDQMMRRLTNIILLEENDKVTVIKGSNIFAKNTAQAATPEPMPRTPVQSPIHDNACTEFYITPPTSPLFACPSPDAYAKPIPFNCDLDARQCAEIHTYEELYNQDNRPSEATDEEFAIVTKKDQDMFIALYEYCATYPSALRDNIIAHYRKCPLRHRPTYVADIEAKYTTFGCLKQIHEKYETCENCCPNHSQHNFIASLHCHHDPAYPIDSLYCPACHPRGECERQCGYCTFDEREDFTANDYGTLYPFQPQLEAIKKMDQQTTASLAKIRRKTLKRKVAIHEDNTPLGVPPLKLRKLSECQPCRPVPPKELSPLKPVTQERIAALEAACPGCKALNWRFCTCLCDYCKQTWELCHCEAGSH